MFLPKHLCINLPRSKLRILDRAVSHQLKTLAGFAAVQPRVPGAGGNNIGLSWPIFAVTSGDALTVSTWFESTSYTGACTAGLIVKQGNTVVATAT